MSAENDKRLIVGSLEPADARTAVQGLLIILPEMVRKFQPPLPNASKWRFHRMEVVIRLGCLELSLLTGSGLLFFPHKDTAEFIRLLRSTQTCCGSGQALTIVHLKADDWREARWHRWALAHGDHELLYFRPPSLEAIFGKKEERGDWDAAILTAADRAVILERYDAHYAALPPAAKALVDGKEAPADPPPPQEAKLQNGEAPKNGKNGHAEAPKAAENEKAAAPPATEPPTA